MELKMKNFNILGVHWKIWLLGGSSQKTNIKGRLPEKEGLGQLTDLRGGLVRKRGWCFWGGGGVDTLMHTMLHHIKGFKKESKKNADLYKYS